MATTTTSTLKSELNWTQTDTGGGTNSTKDIVSVSTTETLSDGTGIGNANTVWYVTGTLSSGGSDTYDLYNLSRSVFDNTLDISYENGDIKYIMLHNTSTNAAQSLTLNSTLADGFDLYSEGVGCEILVYPSGTFSVSNPNGYATAADKRYLRVSDSGGQGATYEIGIVGSV